LQLIFGVGLFAGACGGDSSRERAGGEVREEDVPTRLFVITIDNASNRDTLKTSEGNFAVNLSPGAYAIHEGANPLFRPGDDAPLGMERLAEDGQEIPLARELQDRAGVFDSGTFSVPLDETERGALRPGGTYQITVRAGRGERFSFATMFGNSNDLFFAPDGDGIPLFDNETGEPVRGDVTNQVLLWDAGTEVNEEPEVGPNTAPQQPEGNTGPDEGEVVRLLQAVDDPYNYPAVDEMIRVTIEPQ
jgi:hypothetical protein